MRLFHPGLERWVNIVTKRGLLPETELQLDAVAIERMKFWMDNGFSNDDALRRVLGI